MSFNPKEHLRTLGKGDKAQDYLDVKWRLVWFRETHPQGRIETEELAYDLDREVEAEIAVWNNDTRRMEKVLRKARGYARYRAIVEDGQGGRATGTKSENAANFPDFGEKAETGAIGRALAGLGFGTQFAPEFDEEHRIVDSPVDRTPADTSKTSPQPPQPPQTAQPIQTSNGTDAQKQAISTLLGGFKEACPEKCVPGWKVTIVREALDLASDEAMPSVFTPDDVHRVELHIKSMQRAA